MAYTSLFVPLIPLKPVDWTIYVFFADNGDYSWSFNFYIFAENYMGFDYENFVPDSLPINYYDFGGYNPFDGSGDIPSDGPGYISSDGFTPDYYISDYSDSRLRAYSQGPNYNIGSNTLSSSDDVCDTTHSSQGSGYSSSDYDDNGDTLYGSAYIMRKSFTVKGPGDHTNTTSVKNAMGDDVHGFIINGVNDGNLNTTDIPTTDTPTTDAPLDMSLCSMRSFEDPCKYNIAVLSFKICRAKKSWKSKVVDDN